VVESNKDCCRSVKETTSAANEPDVRLAPKLYPIKFSSRIARRYCYVS